MNKIRNISFLIILCAALSGCYVQSFYPFYTQDSVIEFSQMNGEWQLFEEEDGRQVKSNNQAWVFHENQAKTYDEDNVPGELSFVYFKIGGNVFADVGINENEDLARKGKLNQWWTMNVMPVHTLVKVELNHNKLALIPLNADWVNDKIESNALSLPFIKSLKDEYRLFTATPQQWEEFIRAYQNDPNAFEKKHQLTFERKASPEGVPIGDQD